MSLSNDYQVIQQASAAIVESKTQVGAAVASLHAVKLNLEGIAANIQSKAAAITEDITAGKADADSGIQAFANTVDGAVKIANRDLTETLSAISAAISAATPALPA